MKVTTELTTPILQPQEYPYLIKAVFPSSIAHGIRMNKNTLILFYKDGSMNIVAPITLIDDVTVVPLIKGDKIVLEQI